MASIKQDPYMKFLGGFITYDGKGVLKLIYEKMKLELENIMSCLVRDEHKVRIYKECFLPANRFILLIHDLTKTVLKNLDDQMHGLVCPKVAPSYRYILGSVWM
jgi:hypothetical protein